MRIGALRQRLDIQFETVVGSTNDGHFEGQKRWLNWKEGLPCDVSVRRGQEHFLETNEGKGGQRFAKDVWFFTVRYQSVIGVSSTMRVLYGGMTFDIRHVRPDAAKKREVTLECEVIDAQLEWAPLVPAILMVIPPAETGQPFGDLSISASGGLPPYVFTSDTLPPGLSIDSSTGEISGSPTQPGDWDCSVSVTDSSGAGPVSLDFVISVTGDPVPEVISYSVAAGENANWIGYFSSGMGSIDAQPIDDATLGSTVAFKHNLGEGGIEIVGPVAILQPLLEGKDVYVDGELIPNILGWSFSSNQAVWWVSDGFPVFDIGNEYLIEIK